MKYLTLETLSDFVCSGDKCEFTCCAGWNISIDSETDEYYKTVDGEIGDRLRSNIRRENGKSSFILTGQGKCPFLNEKGLCDIYITLGEKHLSNTCTYYPRYSFYSGDICFAGVSISCPEVAKTFLNHEDPLLIDFGEDDQRLSADDERSIDWITFNHSIRVLTNMINIAQNRDISIRERLALIIIFADQFQVHTDNGQDPSSLISLFSDSDEYVQILSQTNPGTGDYNSKISFSSEFLSKYRQVDHFEDKLPEISELIDHYSDPENASFNSNDISLSFEWVNSNDNRIWQENLLVYVIFRYFMQGFDKKDFYDRLMVGINEVYNSCIFELVLYHSMNGLKPATNDYIVMLISHISRIIEHDTGFQQDVFDCFKSKGLNEMSFLLRLIS